MSVFGVEMRIIFFTVFLVVSVSPFCSAEDALPARQYLVYAVWAEPTDGRTTTIHYSYMKDKSWTQPIQLPLDNGLHVTPVIAVDNDRNIWIIWIEQTKDENILRYAFIHHENFTTGRVNKKGNEQSYAPAILIDGSNKPLIAWAGVKKQFSDIYYSKWSGDNWGQPMMVNSENESPDIMPIIGLAKDNIPWISWFGYVDKYKYVQFLAKLSDEKWSTETKTLSSTDVKLFIQKRITLEEHFPEQARKRLMGAMFVGSGEEIQSISDRFVSFK